MEEAKHLPLESLQLIARNSGGSFRDGEVLLEKVVSHNQRQLQKKLRAFWVEVF